MVENKTKPKILCVDDQAGVLEALERLLRDDFEVFVADGPDQGLKILHTVPDLAIILSDYRMPGQNGVDFLRQAKVVCPLAVRAILSGQMDLRQMAEALNGAEIHRFILKPWENDYLRIQMLEAVQTHRLLASREELRALSITDPVTGLTNHRYFQAALKKLCDRAQPVSLVMLDVDHFKNFNDLFGHPMGDRLLQELAMLLGQGLGTAQSASRYGGEEFAIILPSFDALQALAVAEAFRTRLAAHVFQGPAGPLPSVTVSLGVAAFPAHATTAVRLIECADAALLEAKRAGRNRTVVAV